MPRLNKQKQLETVLANANHLGGWDGIAHILKQQWLAERRIQEFAEVFSANTRECPGARLTHDWSSQGHLVWRITIELTAHDMPEFNSVEWCVWQDFRATAYPMDKLVRAAKMMYEELVSNVRRHNSSLSDSRSTDES